jgi:hypothetical protein
MEVIFSHVGHLYMQKKFSMATVLDSGKRFSSLCE